MKKSLILLSAILCILSMQSNFSNACTIFRLKAKDGSLMVTRSMEFGVDLKYDIVVVPRNYSFTSPFLNNKTGISWKTKYGYVAVASLGLEYGSSDGMNEKGLSVGALWFENDMKYQEVTQADSSVALAQAMFTDWVLGNFFTVEELKTAISKVKVFKYIDYVKKMAPTLHFAIFDANGGSIVVEYENGQCNIYTNPLGIMTNAPRFPWHIANLRQYLAMKPELPDPITVDDYTLYPTGHGSGMFGVPGDYTPPSRFVRLAMLTYYSDKQPNAAANLNLSQHIMNTFDIPFGLIVDKDADGKVTTNESTQWVTIRDLTNKIMYFRTYENMDLRKIDYSKLDFNAKSVKRIPMFGSTQSIIDVVK